MILTRALMARRMADLTSRAASWTTDLLAAQHLGEAIDDREREHFRSQLRALTDHIVDGPQPPRPALDHTTGERTGYAPWHPAAGIDLRNIHNSRETTALMMSQHQRERDSGWTIVPVIVRKAPEHG